MYVLKLLFPDSRCNGVNWAFFIRIPVHKFRYKFGYLAVFFLLFFSMNLIINAIYHMFLIILTD